MKVVLIIFSFFLGNSYSRPSSFGQGKTQLKNKIYPRKGKTFYCNCDYQKNTISVQECQISLTKFKKRKYRLEWEHVVAAHAFGHSFEQWRSPEKFCKGKKGKKPNRRKCTRKKSKLFREMEGNVFNLVPSVGSVNALRSNYSFIDIDKSDYPICKRGFKIKGRKVSPPLGRKGDIARIYMYMNWKYPGRGIISKKNKKLFERWSVIDPVDVEECLLHKKKAQVQGENNPFIFKHCKVLK